MTILDTLADESLFARWFAAESWRAWRVFLCGLFALPIEGDDLDMFRRHTGRTTPPADPSREAWAIVGRRGGKSQVAALLAVFFACFRDYRPVLGPGEVATVMVLAADRRQARVCLRFIRGLLTETPMLARMIVRETRETIELNNRVTIEIHTATHKSVRGYSCAVVIADEVAVWPTAADSAFIDVETINALRPTLMTTGGLLIGVSSPYARKGILWEQYQRHFGKDASPVLCWQASTEAMNPLADRAEIERALEENESAARAEYFAEFRADFETFLSRETIMAAVVPGRGDVPPDRRHAYQAFVDPSGGEDDSMSLAIGHREGERVVVDAIREIVAKFEADAAVAELAVTLHAYGVQRIVGDHYGGTWPPSRFAAHGISYQKCDRPKSALYLDALPMLTSRRVELPDHRRLLHQLSILERRPARGGKDSVDHPKRKGVHDDIANAVLGLVATITDGASREIRRIESPWG